jgi:hypothetical protein
MKRTVKWTVLAVAISAATAANAETTVDNNITNNWTTNTTIDTDIDLNLSKTKSYTSTVDKSYTSDVSKSYTSDVSKTVDLSYSDSFDRATTVTHDVDTSYTNNFEKNTTIDKNVDLDLGWDYQRNVVDTDITHDEDVNINVDKEVDEHGVSAELESDLSLTSDIDFSGSPTVSGDLEIDSAAIAVIDNRQSNSNNIGLNDTLTNDASIADDTATEAEGNLQFNVAAGDNNQQDNAAALSAADASFAFGLADSKVFVQQSGTGNGTANLGQTNTASVGDAAFADATGNIGVNVTSGNNNQQKNALAASVATSKYASAAVSTNQNSSGNAVANAPKRDVVYDEVSISLSGSVEGWSAAAGWGGYEGETSGTYAGSGNAYQSDNFYLDTWDGELDHPNGESTGHIDLDNEIQGAVPHPTKQGVGGIAFDTTESGEYEGSEEGELGFYELGYSDLWASLSGTVEIARDVITSAATNTASLSGDAFARASGNIGVNVSAGTGNQQANALSLAVAQPSTATPPPAGDPPG